MDNWMDFDFDKTIRDFEYTKRAVANMDAVISSKDFETMDADMIFHYLLKQMTVVLFPDYLKRYIYKMVGIDAPFSSVDDSVYADIIITSFKYNEAPFSFTANNILRSQIIKGWLHHATVRRNNIFVLGFGLRMTSMDVSEFLTKVIQEEDFNFSDPEETIYWYCYTHSIPYTRAKKLLNQFHEMTPVAGSEKKWKAMSENPEMFLISESNLMAYLGMLKYRDVPGRSQEIAYTEFLKLYERCREIIADQYNMDAEYIDNGKHVTAEQIGPYDLERVLCSGNPVSKDGNLKKISASKLHALFRTKRLQRQRIHDLLNRKRKVRRFDLITLLFFIYAETIEPEWPAERYLQYIDAINAILKKCSMHGIYPVNPYEAFVLMCLVTSDPLDAYSEIWAISYDEE